MLLNNYPEVSWINSLYLSSPFSLIKSGSHDFGEKFLIVMINTSTDKQINKQTNKQTNKHIVIVRVKVMVFNATFNNISSHNHVLSTPHLSGVWTHNVSGDRHSDCIGSYKSNYHTFTTTTAPILIGIIILLHIYILFDKTQLFCVLLYFYICCKTTKI